MCLSIKRLLVIFLFGFVTAAKAQKISAKHPIITFAEDGAWLWFNDQNILVDKEAMYIGCEDSKGYSSVAVYQFSANGNQNSVYPLSTFSARDDHNYPALLKLTNGDILATYSKNPSRKMYYRIAKISTGISIKKQLTWDAEKIIDLDNGMSYNNCMMLTAEANRIYNWYSIFTGSPSIISSDDQGESWSKDFSYMKAGKNHSSPYLKYSTDGKDRVDILYTDGHPRNEAKNNIYHIFYRKENFYKSDGTLIKSLNNARLNPIDPADGTKIYDGTQQGPGWVWDIEYNHYKNPVAVYISAADFSEGNDLRYRYAKWDAVKKQWNERQIAYAGNHLYVPENHFAGGVTIDPENTNLVYISTNVNPYTGKLLQNNHYQIFCGVTKNDGATFTWEQLTFDSTRDNLRPIVPRNHPAKICVLWLSGLYKSSLNFKTKVEGIFEKK